MTKNSNILCCCEYLDQNNERSHMLLCCCNCVDLDEGVSSFISGEGFPEKNKRHFLSTMNDRMRIPWRGGAKQVSFDSFLPVIILPIAFITAAQSLWWTIFAFTAVIVILVSIFRFFIVTIPRTKFFLVWTSTSVVILYVIFELIVIPYLQILLEENVAVSIFIGLSLYFLYKTKYVDNLMCKGEESSAEEGIANSLSKCSICQVMVPEKDHHCFWIDCCIGSHNQMHFISALFFGFVALLYTSNLTLTTVCHPFVLFFTILLPDDCSEVYDQFEMSISFIAGVYALGLSLMLLMLLVQQVMQVSLGLSAKEWRNLSLCAKLRLGLCTKRSNDLGLIANWKRII